MCKKEMKIKFYIYNLRLWRVLRRMLSFSWADKGRNAIWSLPHLFLRFLKLLSATKFHQGAEVPIYQIN